MSYTTAELDIIAGLLDDNLRMPAVITRAPTPRKPWASYRKVGGLHFVRVWRFGFTFYLTSRKEK